MPDWVAFGNDGFSMLLGDEVKTIVDEENGLCIIDIVKQSFKRTRTDYKIVPKREERRQMRLKLLGVNVDDEEGRSPDGVYYKINP